MKIALLIGSLGGGGAERVAQILGDYYVEKGNDVYYFLEDSSVEQVYPVKGKVINTGIRSCVSNNFFGDAQILVKLLAASLRMRKLKKIYKIDVAISFMEEMNYINVLSKGSERVITRVCTILSKSPKYSGILYYKSIVRLFYGISDKVVVLCNDAVDDMHRNYKIALRKMTKIPNPVLAVTNSVTKNRWEYGGNVIIDVGRLSAEKQHERIIRAFSYVYKHEQTARLLILGEGPQERYLKGLCSKYGLEKQVIFAGFKSNVGDYYRNSKAFVMASIVEGMPNSMLEAMANGLPVVTTDSPGACAEILGKKGVSGKCRGIEYCTYGILTPYISSEVKTGGSLAREELFLGQAMLELIRNEALCQRYSERSRKRASMYHIEKIMKKWNQLFL